MSNSRSLRELFPCVLGLAFGRLSFTLGSFGSYQSLHEGFGNLEAVGVFALLIAIAVIFFFVYKARLTDAQALLGARIGIISAALVIATGVVIQGSEALRGSFTFFLSLLLSVLAAGVLFYWLRLAKGARSSVAVAYVFSALGLSELILFVLNMLPSSASAMLTIVLTLGQLPCLAASRQSPPLRDLVFAKGTIGFYDFAPRFTMSPLFLACSAIAVGLLSLAVGALRGFPDGFPITLSLAPLAVQTITLVSLSILIVALASRGNRDIISWGLWALVELAAVLALVLYALFPEHLLVGGALTAVANALLGAIVCYVAISFETIGKRDPYYYALAAWLTWTAGKVVGRVALLLAAQPSPLVIFTMLSACLMVSALAIFMGYQKGALQQTVVFPAPAPFSTKVAAPKLAVTAPLGSTDAASRAAQTPSPSAVVVGGEAFPATPAPATPPDAATAWEEGLATLSETYMLSDRERQVLELYAGGYTQKRVAQELGTSLDTAHTHIMHIYAKTGLHSRQDIIDYLRGHEA
ncbi:MAG: helix-turn-helix transcriptional regulator [Adlercreutzia sp.]|nr:helix-turn-helix transcriptional regulator [Adlercreutzia sp.]